jgi:glycosyltransferase involved in cell wall biosynthesis
MISSQPRKLAIVLWRGAVGGAETVMGDLAISMHDRGIDVTVLCVGDSEPLAGRLHSVGVRCVSLGYRRGSAVLLHPRHMVAVMRDVGRDGAIVNAAGYLPWFMRVAGYRASMLVVEHGDALNLHTASRKHKLRVRIERWLCARARYTDIAVSDTLLEASVQATGRRDAKRIYNGVNLRRFRCAGRAARAGRDVPVTIGVASRLAPGKGIENILTACALLGVASSWRLLIAGDGPEAATLRRQAESELALRGRVSFLGTILDMPSFWSECDIAVVASSQWIESFSMAAVEAMACGLPVIASASGALPEVCGASAATLVPAGDPGALAAALRRYIDDPAKREAHGKAGRQRAEERFDVELMVDRYLQALDGAHRSANGPGTPDARDRHARIV